MLWGFFFKKKKKGIKKAHRLPCNNVLQEYEKKNNNPISFRVVQDQKYPILRNQSAGWNSLLAVFPDDADFF